MKKIMLIIFSVTMLFTACEKQTENITDTTAKISAYTPKTQIDPADEFDGITFGMTKDEIISFLKKEPKFTVEDDSKYTINHIEYWDEEHFNVSNAVVEYRYKNDQALLYISYNYYYNDSEQEQFMNDYEIIKEEILRRYPEQIWVDYDIKEDNDKIAMTIYTENRIIDFDVYTDILWIKVIISEYEPTEDTPQTQIDPTEEFGGITFGMTKDEVITVLDRSPDQSYEFEDKDGYGIWYYSQKFFDVTTYNVAYHFDENGKLYCIWAFYTYYDKSEKEQMSIDLDHVKEELFKYYPENTLTSIDETDNELFLFTESRLIRLKTYDGTFDVAIKIRD